MLEMESRWNEMFNQLHDYYTAHGDTLVPSSYPRDQVLSNWVAQQRAHKKHQKLTASKIQVLESIDFAWVPADDAWLEMYEQAKDYFLAHGSIEMYTPRQSRNRLSRWVVYQRVAYNKGLLSEVKFVLLEAINFVWDVKSASWSDSYMELINFKAVYGHTRVPKRYQNRQLYVWVYTQRDSNKNYNLSESRQAALNVIGFEWVVPSTPWESNYLLLIEFKRAYGHCRVKMPKSGCKKLPNWVIRQRQCFKKGELSCERIALLDSIGFEWRVEAALP